MVLGRLLAAGRWTDIYELGPDRVLRRYRDPAGMPPWEVAVMRQARAHGVPAPEVLDVDGLDTVLERVHGPTMLEDLARRPWRLREHARTLIELHRLVHQVPAPAGPPTPFDAGGDGECLLHLDLHPANVILAEGGPVLLDWQGAVRGPAAADLAQTYVLLATSTIPGPWHRRPIIQLVQSRFAATFRAAAGPAAIESQLSPVARRRLTDAALLPLEAQRIHRLLSTTSA